MNLLRGFKRPRTLAERYLERGLYALDHRKYDDAIADLTEAIAHEPENAELYTTRGFIYLQSNNADYLPYARADFEYALHLDSQQMVAQYGLGMMAYAAGDYHEAMRRFDLAREISPLRAEIYYYRALCRYQLGDPQGAVKEMEELARPLFAAGDPRHLDAAKWINVFKKAIKGPSASGRKSVLERAGQQELSNEEPPLLTS